MLEKYNLLHTNCVQAVYGYDVECWTASAYIHT